MRQDCQNGGFHGSPRPAIAAGRMPYESINKNARNLKCKGSWWGMASVSLRFSCNKLTLIIIVG